MAIYLAMTLGTFACILSMRRTDGMVEEISDLAGLARTNPALAFFLALLLFSLAGIPPLAGFFAKYYVFLAAIKAGLFTLAVIGVLASVVGAYYYLMIVKIMYFDEPAKGFEPMPVELKAVLGVTGLFNLLYFVYPAPLLDCGERRGEIAVLMQLDPTAAAAGVRLVAHDTIGSTNAEALRAGARRRARAAVDHREAPDRGPRPARPRLGVGAGQSLRQPAADRSGAAGARAGTVVRRGAGGARRGRRAHPGPRRRGWR